MKPFSRTFARMLPSLREAELKITSQQPKFGHCEVLNVEGRSVELFIQEGERECVPVIFHLHGGGFCMGDASKGEELRKALRSMAGYCVVGVNYSKAPENPYPAAIEDVCAVLKYFAKNANEYNIDPHRFSFIGFSCGANLAVAASMHLKNEKSLTVRSMVLHYPYLDARDHPPSRRERFPTDLNDDLICAFNELYCPPELRDDPLVSPLLARDEQLEHLCPTLIMPAEYDMLKYESFGFAERLKSLGVEVHLETPPYSHHGYFEENYNQAVFDNQAEDTRAKIDPRFREAAEHAMKRSCDFIVAN